MKKTLSFFTAALLVGILQAQISYNYLQDGSNGIANGYGSWGSNTVIHESEINDANNDGIINFYHPDIAEQELPTIFFISGWGRPAYTYEKFFYFLASQGYAVINIYNNTPGNTIEAYQFSLNMMVNSKQVHYSNWIDTSKIGLMGHSYGAGATIWLGKNIFGNTYNWGTNGRFIFMSAPWYSLLVTEDDLINYPSNVKLVIEINNDDIHEGTSNYNTDERAIRAVFELINIPNSEKDFIRVFSDATTYQFDADNDGTLETYHYDANHYISYTGIYNNAGNYQAYDALDVYAINRISHALIDYTFNGNLQAKDIALGNGSNDQINMDFLTDLEITDTPIITRLENQFQYPCHSNWNDFQTNQNIWFLQNACDDTNGDGIIDLVEELSVYSKNLKKFNLYPIPTSDYISIDLKSNIESIKKIEIFDTLGKKIETIVNPINNTIILKNYIIGTYYLKLETENFVQTQSFLVK